MAWLAPKLRNRIQIWRGIQTPRSDGGFDLTYKKLVRLWAKLDYVRTGNVAGYYPIRGTNDEVYESHRFVVRYSSVIGKTHKGMGDGFGNGYDSWSTNALGTAFTNAFGEGTDSVIDMNPIKADYFVFLERENQYRGKLFRITKVIPDDVHSRMITLKCMEEEERGTGYPE
jgi:hypothetical protein